jgi:hypothetical protein
VSFFLPSDSAYQSVKRLKQGTSRLDSMYDSFVAAFDERFGFPPLGVGVDTMERPKRAASNPRLGVVLERSSQCLSFNASPEPFANYDPVKQRQVAELLVEQHSRDRLATVIRHAPTNSKKLLMAR